VENILHHIPFGFTDQRQSLRSWLLRCFSPLYGFWGWFILFPSLLFFSLFLLLLLIIFFFWSRHEFPKQQSWQFVWSWVYLLNHRFCRNRRQLALFQFKQNLLIVYHEILLFLGFLFKETHEHFLLFIHFLFTFPLFSIIFI